MKFVYDRLATLIIFVVGTLAFCLCLVTDSHDRAVVAAPPGSNPFRNRVELPDLPPGMEWFNTKKSISKADLKGKFVLFDFWTYCCINCMHILPELKKLEKKYPNELVVIGVHSAKFETEKDSQNILQAMLRDEVEHLVVNDAQHKLWDFYGVNVWPTLLLVDPEGKVIHRATGEFKAADVARFLETGIPYYRQKKLLDEKPFPIDLIKAADTPLLFPGKILADEPGNRLFISDSNHNRIVVTTLEGKLIDTIGSGAIGRDDGDFTKATFNHPQGCALHKETLYVADTENHTIRKVDLKAKTVKTIAGTGKQSDPLVVRTKRGLPLKGTSLSSPWDLYIHRNDLYIAMAGTHQIWKMSLSESEIGPYAGNGREDVVDGKLLPKSAGQPGSSFAQPSGLGSDGQWLYVADSEGSSIRAVPLDPSQDVYTVVGTAGRPDNRLFDFGDYDGPRDKAKFQHCIGVTYADGAIYVADTYNNAIRVVDPMTGETTTLAGMGHKRPGNDDVAGSFDEPAGVSYAKGIVYVADTNNHSIRTLDLKARKIGTLNIAGLTAPNPTQVVAKPSFAKATEKKYKLANVKPGSGGIALHITLKLPDGLEINQEAPMYYWVDSPQPSGPLDRAAFGRKKLEKPQAEFDVIVPVTGDGEDSLAISFDYLYCRHGEEGVCKAGAVIFTVPLNVSSAGLGKTMQLVHTIED